MKKVCIERIDLRIFFVIAFIFLPRLIVMAIPTNWIYDFKTPVMTKSEYETCEPLVWIIERKSLLATTARISQRIVDGQPVVNRNFDSFIEKTSGYRKFNSQWTDLCLEPDTYYLEGIIEFDLLGVTKTTVYKTASFKVVNSKLDDFITAGKRFTFCDGLLLYSQFKPINLPKECQNCSTDFCKYIKK